MARNTPSMAKPSFSLCATRKLKKGAWNEGEPQIDRLRIRPARTHGPSNKDWTKIIDYTREELDFEPEAGKEATACPPLFTRKRYVHKWSFEDFFFFFLFVCFFSADLDRVLPLVSGCIPHRVLCASAVLSNSNRARSSPSKIERLSKTEKGIQELLLFLFNFPPFYQQGHFPHWPPLQHTKIPLTGDILELDHPHGHKLYFLKLFIIPGVRF